MRTKAAALALEAAFLFVGIAALTVYGLMEFEQMHGQAGLREQFAGSDPSRLPAGLPADELQEEESAVAPGEALGRLTAERIGLDVMIAEGVDRKTLRRAAGRIPGTALLGGKGNVGIAAHRDTFFRPLRKVEKGDVLKVETRQGLYSYRVDWTAVVEPSNIQFLGPSSDSELTLVTCFPFYFVGPAPRRFIVRATRVNEDSTTAAMNAAHGS